MRLYLSSFRLGGHPEHLLRLLRGQGQVAVISNAMDGATSDVRRSAVQLELDALAGIGLDAVDVDLRDHVDDSSGMHERLELHPALWVRGGNTFVLRSVMVASGADTAIVDLVRRGRVVYAGYSAGACVLAPDLDGLEAVDDVSEVQRTYGREPVWGGLGLLGHAVVPHVDSPGHPETADCTLLAQRYERAGVAHLALCDGQALVVDDAGEQVV